MDSARLARVFVAADQREAKTDTEVDGVEEAEGPDERELDEYPSHQQYSSDHRDGSRSPIGAPSQHPKDGEGHGYDSRQCGASDHRASKRQALIEFRTNVENSRREADGSSPRSRRRRE